MEIDLENLSKQELLELIKEQSRTISKQEITISKKEKVLDKKEKFIEQSLLHL
ncbi:hypothetical protein NJT12_15800 [Flavobacterium sp. AC]|uniref:Uncharacterized protein n=1 Tax=Flavobacterium azizsancarii TaxID=2961580 RepID=A0ABT4WG59_9FLAO|nr:hypothetical protein [Flavobacterium azizsancarii]MDA6071079.1 hypothetical protein [Flavobacterium azizsancarii]